MNDQTYRVNQIVGYCEPDLFVNDLEAAKARAIERSWNDDVWGIYREGDGNEDDELIIVVVGQQLFFRNTDS